MDSSGRRRRAAGRASRARGGHGRRCRAGTRGRPHAAAEPLVGEHLVVRGPVLRMTASATPCAVLDDEGADQQAGCGQRQKQRRPISGFDRRKHRADDDDERYQRRDQLAYGKLRHRAAIFLTMCSKAADALLLRLGHRIGTDDLRWTRLTCENVDAALCMKRLLNSQVQGLGPPGVESNAVRRSASRSIFHSFRETESMPFASEMRVLWRVLLCVA